MSLYVGHMRQIHFFRQYTSQAETVSVWSRLVEIETLEPRGISKTVVHKHNNVESVRKNQ